MGNCLVREEQVTRIMKPDGKVLEYKASITVREVLSEFSSHAISETLQASQSQHLQPDTKLLHGHLYYLLPLPITPKNVQKKKRVRFTTPEEEPDQGTGVVRIKLVISKQELHDMLAKGGLSMDEMVLRAQNRESIINRVESCDVTDNCQGWKPVLESIPE